MVYHVLVSLHWAYTRPTMVAYVHSQYIDSSHMHLHADGIQRCYTLEDYQAACGMWTRAACCIWHSAIGYHAQAIPDVHCQPYSLEPHTYSDAQRQCHLVYAGLHAAPDTSSLGIVSSRWPVAALRSALLLSGRTSHGRRSCSSRPCRKQRPLAVALLLSDS